MEKNEYEKIQDQLFLYTSSEVKKEEIKRTDNTLGVNIAITGIMFILFFFIFFLIFDKRRKGDVKMQLTITLTSTKYQINKDIMVNSEQKICETLQILKEAGQINIAVGDEDKLRSMRTGMFVPQEFTYEEAGIFYGDILAIL